MLKVIRGRIIVARVQKLDRLGTKYLAKMQLRGCIGFHIAGLTKCELDLGPGRC
jgi:hypothetical protein